MAETKELLAKLKLLSVLKSNKLKIGIEVGVQNGEFSKMILENTQCKKLYMVDAWRHFEGYNDRANASNTVHSLNLLSSMQNTEAHREKTCILVELSLDAAKLFPDGFFDFIYLDAAHDKKSVLADIKAWYPKLKNKGIICGDDYMDGYVNETDFGVKSAVNAFFKNKVNEIPFFHDMETAQWWVKK